MDKELRSIIKNARNSLSILKKSAKKDMDVYDYKTEVYNVDLAIKYLEKIPETMNEIGKNMNIVSENFDKVSGILNTVIQPLDVSKLSDTHIYWIDKYDSYISNVVYFKQEDMICFRLLGIERQYSLNKKDANIFLFNPKDLSLMCGYKNEG